MKPVSAAAAKRLFAVALATSVSALGVVASAAPASASVTCSGSGCNDTDPYATGCASSAYVPSGARVTLYKGSTSVAAGYAELWYSTTCHTNWTEVVIYDDGLNDIYSEYGAVLLADGRSLSYTNDGYGTPLWTNQEYAPTTLARACGQILADSFSTGVDCTGWY